MQKFKVTIEIGNDVGAWGVWDVINAIPGVQYVGHPEPVKPEEPEWKQKVRKLFEGWDGASIDNEGFVHGLLYTIDITKIIELGGLLFVNSSGKVQIGNWKDC